MSNEPQASWEVMTTQALEGFQDVFAEKWKDLLERHPGLKTDPALGPLAGLAAENATLTKIVKQMSARITALEDAATS